MSDPPEHQPRSARARPFLFGLLLSFAAHVGVLQLIGGPGASGVSKAPVRQALTVEIQSKTPQHAAQKADAPAPPDESVARIVEPEPIEPVSAEEPESHAEPAAVSQPDQRERTGRLGFESFLDEYAIPDEQLQELAFRPDLRRRIETRRIEQHRHQALRRNRVERTGHEAGDVNDTGYLARIGDACYALSAPATTIERGTGVARIECPGKLDWWSLDNLDTIALFRGIP